jgi:hypothetical protein
MKYLLVFFLAMTSALPLHAQDVRFLNVADIIERFRLLIIGDNNQVTFNDGFTGPTEVPVECYKITDNNIDLLGLSNAGALIIKNEKPGSAFAVWYMNCLDKVFTYILDEWNPASTNNDKLSRDTLKAGLENVFSTLKFKMWSTVSPEVRTQMVHNAIRLLYGSESLLVSYATASSIDQIIENEIKKVPATLNFKQAYVFILTDLAIRDEYLTY